MTSGPEPRSGRRSAQRREAVHVRHHDVKQYQGKRPTFARGPERGERIGPPSTASASAPVREHFVQDRRLVSLSSTTRIGTSRRSIAARMPRLRGVRRRIPNRTVKWNVLPLPRLALDPYAAAH